MILRDALGLGDDVEGQPVGRRARRQPGDGDRSRPHHRGRPRDRRRQGRDRGLAHATGGQALQQNLVCILEGSRVMTSSLLRVIGIGQTKH